MTVRRTTPEDLATVNAWLVSYGQTPHPPGLADVPGFIVDKGAACWLLTFSNAPGAMLEFLVAAPGQTREARSIAVDVVVEAAMAEARAQGVRFICSTTTVDAVVSRSERHGFHVQERGLTALRADLEDKYG